MALKKSTAILYTYLKTAEISKYGVFREWQ